ncbi:MAG: Fe-S cluster assembly ATPase SufC [Treponema sp.]|jgi:Fe-S cluster assembly ATP-binding protein|nr:Fe-S cluster assembly ATPase SufC [Treponema sp.]MBQ8776323.1 Fe-S cluster assembly ATPase SufC [Treponema sp.]MBR2105848.1 Fe-S cluster assembly ATPase SufC [Treponema sp.]MBR6583699.1 Fe-S cluster assembly ATPase SufC [Treponema sp.]
MLLEVQNLNAGLEDGKQILNDLNIKIDAGEIHVLMGPNGAGKSSLGNTLMGNPVYNVTSGKILFKDQDITEEKTDKRAKLGMFMSFQQPLEVPGISLESFIRASIQQKTGEHVKLFQFQKELKACMELLNMNPDYAKRDLNVGFSGGERKKSEILQLLMLKPDFAILDETDSGLDVDAVRVVSKGIEEYRKTVGGSLLIITHNAKILESLKVDYTHILVKGHITHTGDGSLVEQINKEGFEKYI